MGEIYQEQKAFQMKYYMKLVCQDKTKKQEEYAEKILELTESKEFQTEKEQENTDNIIKKAYGNIRNLEEKKKTNIQNVEECNKKIEVLKKKLSKKPGKEEKK